MPNDPLASDAITIARTYLNDDAAANYTVAFLLPKLQEAHRDMQSRLWKVGSPLVRAQSAQLSVAPGITNLNAVGSFPTDLLAPYSVQELDPILGWIPVTEVFYFDLTIAQNTNLQFWQWMQEQLNVYNHITNTVACLINYRRLITIPTVIGSSLGVLSSEKYLGLMTAAKATGSLGNLGGHDKGKALADEFWNDLLTANRGRQTPDGTP